MKCDIIAFAAHPDDVELGSSGTLLHHKALGKTIGIIDLTQGQLGSRGTAELRLKEAEKAAEILGLDVRENLGMEDGWFRNNPENVMQIAKMIRKYRPDIVLANATKDRHPDHGRASKIVSEAAFYSGLSKVNIEGLEAWRPRFVLHYIQDWHQNPDIVVDISAHMDKKMEAISAYGSQFYDPTSTEPTTPISTEEFMEFIRCRAREMGRCIGVEYGEGFTVERPMGIHDLTTLA